MKEIRSDGLGSEIKQIYQGEGAFPLVKGEPPTPPPPQLFALAVFQVIQMVGGIEVLRLCAEDSQTLWRPERSMCFFKLSLLAHE